MEGFYFNGSSKNQSYNYNNITSNYQNYSNSDEYYSKVFFITDVVTYMLIAISLPLTLVAIYALYSMVRRDHVAPIYVINLLISDLIQFCCMTVEVAKFGDWIPRISYLSYIYLSALVASVGFMVCISLERYLVIVHPLWYRFRRTLKTSVSVCALVWVLPFLRFVLYKYLSGNQVTITILALLLLPFPLLIFFLVGTLKALSASISVPSDEKRRIVGILVLVLLIYTLLFLPSIIWHLQVLTEKFDEKIIILTFMLIKLSPLADLFLLIFMRKGTKDKLLASVCCCRMDSSDISSPSV